MAEPEYRGSSIAAAYPTVAAPKVVKREMAASIDQITIELQEAFKG